jgi:hypothetical protein
VPPGSKPQIRFWQKIIGDGFSAPAAARRRFISIAIRFGFAV